MKYNLIIYIAILLLGGCRKTDIRKVPEPKVPSNDKEFISFFILNGQDSIRCLISDSTVTGHKPDSASKENLVAVFTFKGAKVTLNGVEQVSGSSANDFRAPLTYTITAADGSTLNYTVKLKTFTGLPVIYIRSPHISSREQYVDGSMTIDGNIDYPSVSLKIQIKGRGNSTWGKPKNPYKIKLEEKTSLLGMPPDREWALLANWFDKSLLRNDLGFELSEILEMAWTPRRRLVDVYIDSEYQGNYLLTETVKTGKDRLNINVIKDNKPADTLNGYIVEADWRQEGVQTFVTSKDIRYSLKEPESVTSAQLNYITRQFEAIEKQTSGEDNNLSPLLDIDSWVKWTIVNEVMRNRDAPLYGSVFFYQGAGRKIFMGPVWDFDLSSGGYQGNTSTGWYVTKSGPIGEAFMYNKAYRARFKEIWNLYKPGIASLPAYLDKQKQIIELSQLENYKRWENLSISLYEGQVVHQSYDEELQQLKIFLKERIEWIDREINKQPGH
jgi:hypothetical protein